MVINIWICVFNCYFNILMWECFYMKTTMFSCGQSSQKMLIMPEFFIPRCQKASHRLWLWAPLPSQISVTFPSLIPSQ